MTGIAPVLNLGFVWKSLLKLHSTLMWRNVDWWAVTVVSNECIFCVEDGGKTTHRNTPRKEDFSSLKTVILYYILPVQNKLHLSECLNLSTEYIPQRFISFNIISPFVCHRFSHSISLCFCAFFLSAILFFVLAFSIRHSFSLSSPFFLPFHEGAKI